MNVNVTSNFHEINQFIKVDFIDYKRALYTHIPIFNDNQTLAPSRPSFPSKPWSQRYSSSYSHGRPLRNKVSVT